MSKRSFWSVLAVSAAASAVLGGVPAAVVAVTAGSASATNDPAFGSLSPTLAARLSRNVDRPVIVVLKNQFGQATAGTPAASARSAAVSSSQSALLTELSEVHATGVKRFTLVNSVAATVSAAEAQRLAANVAVARVIPDATVSIPASALGLPASPAAPPPTPVGHTTPGGRTTLARTTSLPLHTIVGACAPKGHSYLAPEGLALTNTASANSTAATARSLGFTGAGVKVAFIADGVDPGNVNFIAKNGKSVFVDYQDFTGNGTGAPTDGGEAFLDANTIAGQGTHVYNLNGFAQQGYPNSCDVRIEGVAPGASLVGLDIFSGDPGHTYDTTNSMIAEAINYAVTRDHVNVINESFGDNEFPDTTQDVIKLFDDAAVKAGTVVAASTGDSGTMSTIGSPATDPGVISAGASTQFQMYAQSNFGLARYFSTGWLDDNISGLSSSGYTEQGATVDLVAPGDLSWASCDANTARFADCTSLLGNPSSIEISGGTSESSPFVAGAAALVIQAYRKTHGGSTPAPALVKQIILSTATDLGIPSQEQGAGLLNSDKAVELAESIGLAAAAGSTLLESATQLDYAGLPGSSKSWAVTLTNAGSTTQAVSLRGRTLGPDQNRQSGTVRLNDASSDQLIDFADYPDNYAVFHFTVPPSQSRLDVSIAYPANTVGVIAPVSLTLIDPKGRYAANSDPQGIGDYGNADVRTPAAGTWTAVVNDVTGADGGFAGTVSWQAVTERFTSFGTVSPSSLSIPPGGSRTVTYTATAPAAPGDYAAALEMSSNLGGPTSIPVVLRSLVNVGAGGTFGGVLTGGNGRPGNVGQDSYFSFTVPAGTGAVSAALALGNDPLGGTGGVSVGAYLVSPDGNVVGSGQNYDVTQGDSGTAGRPLEATVLNPDPGTWTLVVNFISPTPGTEVADPFTGTVSFAPDGRLTAPTLPGSASKRLPAGVAKTIPVTITNTGTAPEDYFLDPRLATTTTMTLAPLTPALGNGSNTSALPLAASGPPEYWVPSHTTSVTVRQTSTRPAMTDLSPYSGDPDVSSAGLSTSSLCGTPVSAAYIAPGGDVTSGLWQPGPTECGPYPAAAKAAKATDTVTVTSLAFDRAMTMQTGDLQQLANGAGAYAKVNLDIVEVKPGASVTVDAVITPTGTAGTVVGGMLYLDDVATSLAPDGDTTASEVSALPYSYTVGNAG
jgi:Subtilase family/Peptidase inhibitor I9